MHKLAVIGANGQVGAELCLLLARVPGIELVPVCRNPTGSAYLRYSGIACRHGRPAEALEAAQLFGDCDVIVNCALGTGTPGEIRTFDRNLIRNMFGYSKPNTTVIHCSTLMVHGDPRPGKLRRGRDAYGRAKFAAEGRVRAESKRTGRPCYILRLGHVCGPLQNITAKIHREIESGQIVLPEVDVPSNTLYTVTIVDAIVSILAGKQTPGAFDLTNEPQWTWRQVYEYECRVIGKPFSPRVVSGPAHRDLSATMRRMARISVGRWLPTPLVRRRLESLLALAPSALNDRAQAAWFKMRARSEIGALTIDPVLAPELSWIRLDRRSLPSLQRTEHLLSSDPYKDLICDDRGRWPKDLALAAETPRGALEQPQAV